MDSLNLDLATLKAVVPPETSDVYCYVVRSVEYRDGRFIQTGSGPNFQGDVITLCTCKHWMRSGRKIGGWPGVWVAGFTGVGKVDGDPLDYLFYLMRVAEAHPSHQDLWNTLPVTARLAKAAHLHPLGDLYQPRVLARDPFDRRSYEPPRPDHSHSNAANEWYKDIDDAGCGGRRPPLLVGDRQFSFLWNKPLIALAPPPLTQGCKKHRVSDLLSRLDARMG